MILLLVPAVVVYAVYQIITLVLPRFFLVPSQLWQDKILKVINYPKPIYLNVGSKRSSFRRRLITASVQPSFYTNFVNNKLKLQPIDRENKDDFFVNAMKKRAAKDPSRKLIYGFFHPYANNGGGGEKVLWQAVQATLLEDQRNIVAIYTVNLDAEPLDILKKAADKFDVHGIDAKRVVFIYLRKYGKFIDAKYWKHLTLVGQLVGSAILALEAMYELSPDVWIDTQGLPGSYLPVNLILKVPIVAYVHYPIIQQDMFNKLKFQKFSDFKKLRLSGPDIKQAAKFLYWSLLYAFYIYLGSLVDITLANGTWTYNHIKGIWYLNEPKGKTVEVLFPPCSTEKLGQTPQLPQDTSKLESSENLPKYEFRLTEPASAGESHLLEAAGKPETPLLEKTSVPTASKQESSKSKINMIYVGQFRPEKRHLLVLDQYHTFLKAFHEAKLPLSDLPTLTFLGSCRTPEDSETLESLQSLVKELDLSEYVKFVIDCSFEEVKANLAKSTFGLNAMWNEHFGIGVVEYLGAGVVPIVHASAGPHLDILSTDTPSKGWENEVAFFFKAEEDPDFSGVNDNGVLEFVSGDKILKFPVLSKLFTKLFITSPELVSESSLAKKRAAAKEVLKERFSNKIFATKWIEHLRRAAVLEAVYREDRRDHIDGVY